MTRILATDLDRTLLPNGRWAPDPDAIPRFNQLTEQFGVVVVYVTGRSLALTQQAIEAFGIRFPHVLCGDVGTTIHHYLDGEWTSDDGWVQRVTAASPRWDAAAVREAVADVDGIRPQEPERQNRFKQSYYAEHGRREAIVADVKARVEGRFDEVIVYSYDSDNDDGLVDFLPATATKRTALEYVADSLRVPYADVVFCGDSGNDILPLMAGFKGVVVRNADDQLVANVKAAAAKNPRLQAYFAQGNFRGLNGYYTSGVIEGAYHYGLFA